MPNSENRRFNQVMPVEMHARLEKEVKCRGMTLNGFINAVMSGIIVSEDNRPVAKLLFSL
ncbi:hypothetical protein AGMMS50229_20260 [Campylobacterota bacterium]|nr:hypothetical protein AGMMS50229_20260 [Campylobacterota bacterium]